MRIDLTLLGGLSLMLCLTSCVLCRKGTEARGSIEGVVCTDMNGVARPCEGVLRNSKVLVFSPLCPSCREVIQQIGRPSGLVGISPQSLPYLRYYQLKIPIPLPIFRVKTDDLRDLGITSVPCLLRIAQDGVVTSSEYEIPRILEDLGVHVD